MRAQEIIALKRDGQELTLEQIEAFVGGSVRGEIADYQVAAFLMAVYLRGMTTGETAALTRSMARSGETLDLSGLSPTLDKHSTGGVGDKASLIVVPILAAAGAFVCKMSGRGLGHTGGTLDKLEAIPGFRIGLSPTEMVTQVRTIGACLAGQTETLAPADKKLYALRDATATVGCLPLIVSSILSKKLAGGAKYFLFDVKVGDGAFLDGDDAARELAQALVDGAAANGRDAVAVLSSMDAPLGRTVGNALEVREAIAVLRGEPDAGNSLRELCLVLAGQALALCGIAASPDDGKAHAKTLLSSGAAAQKLREIIAAQGGNERVMDTPDALLPTAPVQVPLLATRSGYVTGIGARRVGEIVVSLGGGRSRKEDAINPAVGVVLAANVGDAVRLGDTLAIIHAASDADAQRAVEALREAVTVGDNCPDMPPLIRFVLHSKNTGKNI